MVRQAERDGTRERREEGLSDGQVLASREAHGSNRLTRQKSKPFWRQFLGNLNDPVIRILLAALAVNISLNSLLIGGHLGAPALGATGAAIATAAARTMELAVVLIFALRADKKLGWRIADIFRPDRALMKDFLRLIRPMLFTSLMFGVAVALQTAILGHMNENAIAANSVASTLFQRR